MSHQTRKPFQFSLRTVLVLLLIIAAALGFWLQEQRLAKARRIMAAHGLAMESTDLGPGEFRTTVISRDENESYVLLTLLVESRQPGSLSIKESGITVLGTVFQQPTTEQIWTAEVRVLVDKFRSFGKEGDVMIKRVLSLTPRGSFARIDTTQRPSGDRKLSEFVKIHVSESGVFELGESIPLVDIGDEQFELEVK